MSIKEEEPPNWETSEHYDPAIDLMFGSIITENLLDDLKAARDLTERREQFALDATSSESAVCKNIEEKTKSEDWATLQKEGKIIWPLAPRMMSGRLEGQFLKTLVSMQNAKRILDIGTFTGYSALAMAESLPADGEVVTIDFDPFLASYVKNLVKDSPHANKITILIGDAHKLLDEMTRKGEQFDMVFIDADKTGYTEYVKFAFDRGLLKPRGTVLADNAFFFGAGYMGGLNPNQQESSESGNKYNLGDNSTKRFTREMIDRTDLHKVVVPMRDGIMILRRMSDVEGATS